MSFRLEEEWPDEKNPYKYYNVPVAGSFATREEAEEEKQRRKPEHANGWIRVVEDKPKKKPAPKAKRRRGLRDDRRRDSRR